jgi:hypothetical protein
VHVNQIIAFAVHFGGYVPGQTLQPPQGTPSLYLVEATQGGPEEERRLEFEYTMLADQRADITEIVVGRVQCVDVYDVFSGQTLRGLK